MHHTMEKFMCRRREDKKQKILKEQERKYKSIKKNFEMIHNLNVEFLKDYSI